VKAKAASTRFRAGGRQVKAKGGCQQLPRGLALDEV